MTEGIWRMNFANGTSIHISSVEMTRISKELKTEEMIFVNTVDGKMYLVNMGQVCFICPE